MGRKPVLGWTCLFLAGVTMTGCRSNQPCQPGCCGGKSGPSPYAGMGHHPPSAYSQIPGPGPTAQVQPQAGAVQNAGAFNQPRMLNGRPVAASPIPGGGMSNVPANTMTTSRPVHTPGFGTGNTLTSNGPAPSLPMSGSVPPPPSLDKVPAVPALGTTDSLSITRTSVPPSGNSGPSTPVLPAAASSPAPASLPSVPPPDPGAFKPSTETRLPMVPTFSNSPPAPGLK